MQHPSSTPPILTIAGSDCSGGAGIQADIKTIEALGGYGMSAITALTAQNTQGVQGVHVPPASFVGEQITSILSDIPPAAIKTGMLVNETIISTVSSILGDYLRTRADSPPPLIIDPVMIAKGGASLLEADAVASLKAALIPLATLVTPNIPEAQALSGQTIHTPEDMQRAAQAITRLGCQNVLIKGGHLETQDNQVHNLLYRANGEHYFFTSPRIHTQHTHGTGCSLAAAIACLMGLGHELAAACQKAETYIAGAIRHAPQLGHGHGPLLHHWLHMPVDEKKLTQETR